MKYETIKWIVWFLSGLLGAFIYYKKFRTETEIKTKYYGNEVFIFIWGCCGLVVMLYKLIINKINK